MEADEQDPFKPLFHHYKVSGHACDVTDMTEGGYRVECSCGWWVDMTDLLLARRYASVHVARARLEIKQGKQRDRRARENQRRAEVGRTPWATSA